MGCNCKLSPKKKKYLGLLVVIFFAGTLVTVIVNNAVSVVSELNTIISRLEYLTVENGVYPGFTIALTGWDNFALEQPRLDDKCFCTVKYNNGTTKPCFYLPMELPYEVVIRGFLMEMTYYIMVITGPTMYAAGEIVEVQCFGIEGIGIASVLLSTSMESFLKLLSSGDSQAIGDYYRENFFTRPTPFNPTGHYNLLRMSREEFKPYGKEVTDVTTYIKAQESRTNGLYDNYTELVFCWESDQYLKVSEVKSGSYWLLVSLIATFLLACERIYGIGNRMLRTISVPVPPEIPPTPTV